MFKSYKQVVCYCMTHREKLIELIKISISRKVFSEQSIKMLKQEISKI